VQIKWAANATKRCLSDVPNLYWNVTLIDRSVDSALPILTSAISLKRSSAASVLGLEIQPALARSLVQHHGDNGHRKATRLRSRGPLLIDVEALAN
jgi:hypothetical protein